jgi:hypothetical protein
MIRQILRIRDNLAGAWDIMLGRPAGLHRLDLTLAGFWRSFGAIILLVPLVWLQFVSEPGIMPEAGETPGASTSGDLVTVAVALLLDWVTFPLVFALLARPLGLGARYVPFIVARNWAAVIVGAMVSVISVVQLIGVLPSVLATVLAYAAIAISLRFAYVIVRTTLAVPRNVALPIVIVDTLISLTIWMAAGRLA